MESTKCLQLCRSGPFVECQFVDSSRTVTVLQSTTNCNTYICYLQAGHGDTAASMLSCMQ
jgi:hypothetical protein